MYAQTTPRPILATLQVAVAVRAQAQKKQPPKAKAQAAPTAQQAATAAAAQAQQLAGISPLASGAFDVAMTPLLQQADMSKVRITGASISARADAPGHPPPDVRSSTAARH
jgi:hypothetical protein